MEFITAEEFLKEDKKVQEVLTKYWLNIVNPKIGFCKKHDEIIFINGETRKDRYPLFTEGQLRKFIEDKEKCVIKVGTAHTRTKNKINYFFILDYYIAPKRIIRNLGNNLLQAYWKVAVQIAKESIKQ